MEWRNNTTRHPNTVYNSNHNEQSTESEILGEPGASIEYLDMTQRIFTLTLVNVVESSRESSIISCLQMDSAQLEKPLSQRNL